jgi:ribosomal protein L16 Arg81 hydroxylase
MTKRDFFSNYWPYRHFAVHGKPERLPLFFTSGELSRFDRLASVYTGTFQINGGKGKSADQFPVQGRNARDFYKFGLGIQFVRVNDCIPASKEWVTNIEMELGVPKGTANLNIFASPKGGGFFSHYDPGEIFLIQIRGRKRVRVARNKISNPPAAYNLRFTADPDLFPVYPRGFPLRPPADSEVIDLVPGSVLFLPGGTWHQTLAVRGESLGGSLTIHFPDTIRLLSKVLRSHLLQSPKWRRPVYGALGTEAQRRAELDRLSTLMAELRDLLPRISVEEILNAGAATEQRLSRIKLSTRFQRDPSVQFTIKKTDSSERVTLELNAYWGTRIARLEFPERYVKLIKWLSTHWPAFSAGEVNTKFPDVPETVLFELLVGLSRTNAIQRLGFVQLLPSGENDTR